MPGEADNVVGTIQLTHSTSLVFSVRPWKGRMLAHVRKFVSGAKYEGPTKAGLAMGGDVLVSVIEALTRLNAEVPGVEERQFAKVHKGGDTDIVVTVIPPDDLKALPSVDVREYVDAETYTGPTKKGVRFPWGKLPEFITILQTQARSLGGTEKAQAILFPEARPGWVKQAEQAGTDQRPSRDAVLQELLPEGPKDFPGEFVNGKKKVAKVELPSEPVSVVVLPGGKHAVQSDLGFRHDVRNPTEGNFILYAYLRGHRKVAVPTEMIEIFRSVKAYENYLRDIRHALLKAYERKSGHRPMAEHQAKEVFKTHGLPWLE
ncbi:MAG: hypothetical protein GXY83_11135 [Rhodopirellula sp.]|nr:hypothetical protein [Rhodopirellula sp.]